MNQVNKTSKLSFSQQQILVDNQFISDKSTYNLQFIFHLGGALNVELFKQSLTEILLRHQILRTTFVNEKELVAQVISEPPSLSFPIVELKGRLKSEQDAQIRQQIKEEGNKPFDLEKEPLVRFCLIRLSEVEHLFLLTFHHIICDIESISVFMNELAIIYETFSMGKFSPLPNLPIQYSDLCNLQDQKLQGKVLDAHLSYWKEKLSGRLPVLEFPTRGSHPLTQTNQGSRQSFLISESLTQALRDLSEHDGVTLAMTLIAAFNTLLYRYTAQEDIIIGINSGWRNQLHSKGLIGCFVNPLVLRTDLSNNPTFQDLLKLVSQVMQDGVHREIPFYKLVEEIKPERYLGRSPIFQVMFEFFNIPVSTFKSSGLQISLQAIDCEIDKGTTIFDLKLQILEKAGNLFCTIEYKTELFDEATIGRMKGHYQTLLEGIVANPSQCLSDLPILTKSERQQLLLEWNPKQSDYPKDLLFHRLFETQVEKSPMSIAVTFENEHLTYLELNCQANQLAHYLQSLQIGPEMLVGICLENSLALAVAFLGVLKAGGACVPLDPLWPKERMSHVFKDSQVFVVLTQQRILKQLPRHDAKIVCLDRDWKTTIDCHVRDNPTSLVTENNLALLFYTSGSTGQPKGVMATHRGRSSRLHWELNTFPLNQSDRHLLKASISAGVFVKEFFWPLLTGAQLIMARSDKRQDSRYIVRLIAEHNISVITVVPTVLQMLLDEPEIKKCQCLKHIFCGGENLHKTLLKKCLTSLCASLYHTYGGSEISTVSHYTYRTGDDPEIITIGSPSDLQIYLLDSHLQLVPIGIPGEIHVGGLGLARGYFNRPDLTAQKFIPNPFNDDHGSILYKTGDIARYLSDGNIQFLGRTDNQVKIRGYRVELGEIETVLNQHPSVRKSVVLAREDIPGDKRLVAYVVTDSEKIAQVKQLHDFLKEKLPDYMLPTFVLLNSIPMNPIGKVDLRALPAPNQTRSVLAESYGAPNSLTEERIVSIWSQVFGLEDVGIHDNFFELGGNSLKAVQVISRLREAFQLEVPLHWVWDAKTVFGLACLLDKIQDNKQVLNASCSVVVTGDREEIEI